MPPKCLTMVVILFLYNHRAYGHHLIGMGWSCFKVDLTVPTLCPYTIVHRTPHTPLRETHGHGLVWSKSDLRCWTVKWSSCILLHKLSCRKETTSWGSTANHCRAMTSKLLQLFVPAHRSHSSQPCDDSVVGIQATEGDWIQPLQESEVLKKIREI